MNKIIVCAISAALALSLTGCDKGPKPGSQDSQQNGGNHVIPGTATAVGIALPANKPSYIEIFPGAEVVAAVSNPIGGKNTSAITLKTTAPMPDVADFYRKSVAKAGFENKGEINMPGVFTLSGEKGESMYSVMLAAEEGNTTVQLLYK